MTRHDCDRSPEAQGAVLDEAAPPAAPGQQWADDEHEIGWVWGDDLPAWVRTF